MSATETSCVQRIVGRQEEITFQTPSVAAYSRCRSGVTTERRSAGQMGQRVIDFRYREYLASDQWRRKRRERLELDGQECANCDATTYLEVHHLTYERLFNERMEDLVTLCHGCHRRLHGLGATRLRVVGEKTPRQEEAEYRVWSYHRFLACAKDLEKALQAFHVHGMALQFPREYEQNFECIESWVGDVVEDARLVVEQDERARSQRRKVRRARAASA